MSNEKSLGQELVESIDEALESKSSGRIARSPFDVKGLRKRLQLTQREFSSTYHINLETLKNWEQDKRVPDLTSIAFLTCIERSPAAIQQLLND